MPKSYSFSPSSHPPESPSPKDVKVNALDHHDAIVPIPSSENVELPFLPSTSRFNPSFALPLPRSGVTPMHPPPHAAAFSSSSHQYLPSSAANFSFTGWVNTDQPPLAPFQLLTSASTSHPSFVLPPRGQSTGNYPFTSTRSGRLIPFSPYHDHPTDDSQTPSMPPGFEATYWRQQGQAQATPLPQLYHPPTRQDTDWRPSFFPTLPPLLTSTAPGRHQVIDPRPDPQYSLISVPTIDILRMPTSSSNRAQGKPKPVQRRPRKRVRKASPPRLSSTPLSEDDAEAETDDDLVADPADPKSKRPATQIPGRLPREARLKIAEKVIEAGAESVNVDELVGSTGLTAQQIRSQLHRKRRNLRAQLMRLVQKLE